MEFKRNYLEKLAGISIPEWEKDMGSDEKDDQLYDYCQLRNAAKDLLRDSTDKEAKKKLSKLIKKLEIDIE